MKSALPTVEQLCDELFHFVQKDQGFAFLSDGMGSMEREMFFSAVRVALFHNKIASQKIAIFLRKYGQIHGPGENGRKHGNTIKGAS